MEEDSWTRESGPCVLIPAVSDTRSELFVVCKMMMHRHALLLANPPST